MLLIMSYDVSALQGGHSVLLVIPHDVDDIHVHMGYDIGASRGNKTIGFVVRAGH